jgi:hypothetical protein
MSAISIPNVGCCDCRQESPRAQKSHGDGSLPVGGLPGPTASRQGPESCTSRPNLATGAKSAVQHWVIMMPEKVFTTKPGEATLRDLGFNEKDSSPRATPSRRAVGRRGSHCDHPALGRWAPETFPPPSKNTEPRPRPG